MLLWDGFGVGSSQWDLENMAIGVLASRGPMTMSTKASQLHIEELSKANHASDEAEDEDSESVKARV